MDGRKEVVLLPLEDEVTILSEDVGIPSKNDLMAKHKAGKIGAFIILLRWSNNGFLVYHYNNKTKTCNLDDEVYKVGFGELTLCNGKYKIIIRKRDSK